MSIPIERLKKSLEGECHYDTLLRTLYATDASVYRELPMAVVLPKTKEDIKKVIDFANEHQLSIIPRAAGTSLAGQCVGKGIVVDISKYMNRILEVNTEEAWVRVQPGVVRDELNAFLKPHGFFFAPITSTANRAMLGGMVGNNSCGSTSIVYGSTRDHVLELDTILSNGSTAQFKAINKEAFEKKKEAQNLEGTLYRYIEEVLMKPEQQKEIKEHFPKPSIRRRNTGYAVDLLLEMEPFKLDGAPFNFCKLLCGSEGTLAFTTEIKLHIDPLPASENVVVCIHFNDLNESLRAVLPIMQHQPSACEMVDKIILDLTKDSIAQQKNRFFVEGDPEAVLMVEFRGHSLEEITERADRLVLDLKEKGYGYAFPKVFGAKTKGVWELRKAGLGILANLPGDPKAVACIEDTAVAVEDLPDYIEEFGKMMENFGQKSVYYAHVGDGEIHLRPILDLKKAKDQQLFYDISEACAKLVKKYRGSLSGEHGDGRVRAAFIPMMIGKKNYQLLKDLKATWDPNYIFNPGKIVETPPMNTSLRYQPDQATPVFDTKFDFSATEGILRAAEKCNGAGDCRKLSLSGGTMCPSYRATRNEKDTTRARANVLREFLTMNTKENPFNHPEIHQAMELCLSCKGCTAECPSNVDMSTLKAEFLYQYYKSNGVPLRAKAIANISKINALTAPVAGLSNFFLSNPFTGKMMKAALGIASKRSFPKLAKQTLRSWWKKNKGHCLPNGATQGNIFLFCDEFTNYYDVNIGIQAVQLLNKLGYKVEMIAHAESGRAHLSKGLLEEAQKMAIKNVNIFKNRITSESPLIGLEPSAILGFRDEYPKLVENENKETAKQLGQNTFLIEEFLFREIQKGNINKDQFSKERKHILLHGHCHQKALTNLEEAAFLLSLPENHSVEIIPSGCCGMAGSFGYEKEHYEVSMKIGEDVLFPALRKASSETIIAAAGTSCRHQIWDGVKRTALHPVEILAETVV